MTRLRWSRGSWMLRTRARHRRRALSNFNRSKKQIPGTFTGFVLVFFAWLLAARVGSLHAEPAGPGPRASLRSICPVPRPGEQLCRARAAGGREGEFPAGSGQPFCGWCCRCRDLVQLAEPREQSAPPIIRWRSLSDPSHHRPDQRALAGRRARRSARRNASAHMRPLASPRATSPSPRL